MSIEDRIQTTSSEAIVHAKFLIYGHAGTGKTSLAATLPNPFIISAEGGLLSLRGANIPYVEVETLDDVREAYQYLKSEKAAHIESVVIDSLSELAQTLLVIEKARIVNGKPVDPRQAYGAVADKILEMIGAFKFLPKHVVMLAKCEKSQDEQGRMLYQPAMVGQKLAPMLPYQFDFVFAMRNEKDADGKIVRYLQTETDGLWEAKQRGGFVDAVELPDLSAIIAKITNVTGV
jgi:phage nucleotide-binding protein